MNLLKRTQTTSNTKYKKYVDYDQQIRNHIPFECNLQIKSSKNYKNKPNVDQRNGKSLFGAKMHRLNSQNIIFIYQNNIMNESFIFQNNIK